MSPPSSPDINRPARGRAALILLALTAAAAALRFAWLDRPCLWGDEALVYWRTCGTYAQLLQPLRADGFPPLHYELYWLIVHLLGHTPDPAAMRCVPALCGTLTVPAVYGLARQLLPRRPSLVAAAFTTFSSFALFYSRDAKMYAEAWLAMTLSVACLLAWLRSGRTTAWLGWVAAGSAAGGLQTLTLVSVVGLSPLLLLTQRRAHWRQLLPWLAGVALIAAGPVGYYARFNGWTANVGDRGWGASGLAWVAAYNWGRTGPDLFRYLASTFLTGWEWPRSAALASMPAVRAHALEAAFTVIALLLLAGLLPWPRAWRDCNPSLAPSPGRPGNGGAESERRTGPVSPDHARRGPTPAYRERGPDHPEPPWRTALWLSAWIGLPLYGFYCRSMPGFATPADALTGIRHPGLWLGAAVLLATAAAVCRPTRAAALRWVRLAVVFAAVVAGCQVIAAMMAPLARAAADAGRPWESVWVPRYLGFVWPPVTVAAAALLVRLPTAPVRWWAIGLVLAVNLGMGVFRVFGSTEPPVDRMTADVWAGQPTAGHPSDTLTWTDLRFAQGGPGGGSLFGDSGRYYLQLLARRPMSPTRFKRSLSTFVLHRGDAEGGVPPAVAAAGAALRRVIVWEQLGRVETPAELPLSGWALWSDLEYPVRDPATAQDLARYRRREYHRVSKQP